MKDGVSFFDRNVRSYCNAPCASFKQADYRDVDDRLALHCDYCATMTKGDNCANCGAPRRKPKEDGTIYNKFNIAVGTWVPTNNPGT